MLAQLAATVLALSSSPSTTHVDSPPSVQVRVDSAKHEVVVTAGRMRLPEGMAYNHDHSETNLRFVWPVSGWARGYRIDVIDSSGQVLPHEILHHAGIANLDRRELAYPVAQRLLAAGRETPAMMLPGSMGIPVAPDQHMVLYYMLVNSTPNAIDGASLRVTIAWTPDSPKGPQSVFPMFVDANPATEGSRSFDLKPGLSTTSAEFTLPTGGHLRALGGHVHDYAVELRLEDAESNDVLAKLTTKRDSSGRLLSITTDRFVFKRKGLHLAENHRYRVVSVYDNPTCTTIARGAMAFMVGPFIPDDVRKWPAVDPTDPRYQEDYNGFVDPPTHAEHSHDMSDMNDAAAEHSTSCTSR